MTDSKFSLPHSSSPADRRAAQQSPYQDEVMAPPEAARSEDGTDRILRIPEAAEYMGISPRQLHELSKAGVLPRIKISKSVRYSLADIRVFLESRKNGGGR